MTDSYDFSGIATAYDVLCQDGRIIKKGAFDHQNDQVVPMVWRHGHKKITNVLGHGRLVINESPPGMRVHAYFNNTDEGQRAKELVKDKDVTHLSIWANQLSEHNKASGREMVREVEHGTIREFSLVLAGKNPGAYIDDVVRHSDDPLDPDGEVEDGVLIHTEFEIETDYVASEPEPDPEPEPEPEPEPVGELTHEDTVATVVDSLTKDQKDLFDVVLHSAASGEETPLESSGDEDDGEGPTVQEVFESLSEEQKTVLYYMAGELSQEANLSQEGDQDLMPKTHNIFEPGSAQEKRHLAHESVTGALMAASKSRPASLREMFLNHDVTPQMLAEAYPEDQEIQYLAHSITNISNFLPDSKPVSPGGPQYYGRQQTWVPGVLNGVRRVPWARLKSNYADLTGADARAKGYVTGAQKVEEVIVALQRETTPVTIYKLQKLDRDYIVDITEFDVVVWLKTEMRMMLQEEVARAILISDGRAAGADKIVETNIRPIYNDDAVYTINRLFDLVAEAATFSTFTVAEFIQLVDYIAESFDDYRGAGNPVFYCQQTLLTKLMTVRDADNHRLHVNRSELADQLGVAAIVPVPVMNGMNRTDIVDPPGVPAGTYDIETLGVIVNLRDYSVGQDRGGEVNFFDDFDIDYNKYTYLYETRMSGALTNPKSAIAIENVVQKTA